MGFDVAAQAYDAFMGRYSSALSPQLADLAGVREGHRVLDVGCGPGALTAHLVERVGSGAVSAIDPSASFVEALRERLPGVDVHHGSAEDLPFEDDRFDVALAQLVVHFMADPVRGLAEMRRVTRPGGTVAACVWDNAGGRGPSGLFWAAARELDPAAPDESQRAGVREGHLLELLASAGLESVEGATLTVRREHRDFDDWWQPYTMGVGPAGAYVQALDDVHRRALEALCRSRLPDGPFVLESIAWAARGTA
jgi:SAM-dependent methyltransferase